MEDARREADRIADMPLEGTNVNPRLVRILKRSGCDTLRAAFDEDERIIQEIPGRLSREFEGLVDSFLEEPAKFVDAMSQKHHAGSVQTRVEGAPSEKKTQPQVRRNRVPRDRRFNYVTEHSLSTPHGEFLKRCQEKAESIFNTLCDRYEKVLVYQAFPYFSVEMDEIRESYLKLFGGYPSHPGKVLDISRQFLPDLFLIFVADLARDTFSGDNLWGNFARVLPLRQNILGDLKELFIDLLDKRGMPLYCQDEAATYYLYTVLLHSGLSRESWEDLWESCLIPLAEELEVGSLGYGVEVSGNAILKEIKNEDGRFSPSKESVLKILQKAPDYTVAPLFESALKAWMQVKAKERSADQFVLVDSFELPEASLTALHDVVGGSSGHNPTSRRTSGKTRRTSQKQIVSLPMADLCLDLDRGVVSIKWSGRQYPHSFLGCRLDFYVDGEKRHEQNFASRLNKCVLEDVDIEIAPRPRYDIELRLMRRSEQDSDKFEAISSHEQSFERSKPGCFEFIRGLDGTFRLRERKDRISRTRQIAYVMKRGFRVEPDAGMTLIAVYESGEAWSGSSAFVFEVNPGASGSIRMTTSDGSEEEVAVWQESYRAHIHKQHVIGETLGGLDLFGFVDGEGGVNVGLPTITIEAADGSAAFRDLDVTCLCNGKSVSVPKEVVWEDSLDGHGSSQIALALNRTWIDRLSEVVEITARQISNKGKVVFRYRFAVIPIKNFKLGEAHVENGCIVADYSFQAKANIEVTDFNGLKKEVHAHEWYSKRMLLKDEFLPITIASEDGQFSVKAKLALVAIEVRIPGELTSLSRKRPICLADAIAMGVRKGEITIKALGWRHNRGVYAMAGYNMLCVKELKQPTEITLNLLNRAKMFVPQRNSEPRDLNMIISIGYGDEEDTKSGKTVMALTDVEALRMREGLGFKTAYIATKSEGWFVSFDKPILCNAEVSFKDVGSTRTLGEERVRVSKGSMEFALPLEVSQWIQAGNMVAARFSPKGRMGKALDEFSFEVFLKG